MRTHTVTQHYSLNAVNRLCNTITDDCFIRLEKKKLKNYILLKQKNDQMYQIFIAKIVTKLQLPSLDILFYYFATIKQ